MDNNAQVYVEGVAIRCGWRDARRNLSELIFESVHAAIDDTQRGIDGIDSVVLASHDLVDGRSLSSMVTAPAAGAYLRDEIRYSDDGAAAFAAAVARIEAGESERLIVAAWGRASEHDVRAVSRIQFDPIFSRPFGLEEIHVSAMRSQIWQRRFGQQGRAQAAQKRKAAAQANPRAVRNGGWQSDAPHPLVPDDMPLWGDMFAAVILSKRPCAVRVAGLGQSSDPYFIGDRDLGEMKALRVATERAYANAGFAADSIDIAEVDGLTLSDEALGLEAMGLVAQGEGFKRLAESGGFNPSGGGAAGYCAPAMGLVRVAEAILQLQGRAGPVQQGRPKRALATGSSVVAGQTHTVVA